MTKPGQKKKISLAKIDKDYQVNLCQHLNKHLEKKEISRRQHADI